MNVSLSLRLPSCDSTTGSAIKEDRDFVIVTRLYTALEKRNVRARLKTLKTNDFKNILI